ncbi:hypothetical protein [Kribbella sp. NPDC050459]|uniref:hypothetical protein n=1 Tax=Kribbella sp. NPDC050459 TaxID=3155785 RepID=UPI0033EE5964
MAGIVGETDWKAIGEEFSRRELTALTKSLEDNGALRDVVDTALTRSGEVDDGRSADFEQAWTTARERPGATVALATYLYASCQAAWELTGDYDKIRRTIEGARTGWDQCGKSVDWYDAATELFLRHVESLPDCMDAEGAVNCSCPIALAHHAGEVSKANAEILPSIKDLDQPGAETFVRFLSGIVEKHFVTYDAIAAVARGVKLWLYEEPSARGELEACKALLKKAEANELVAEDVYASELRAHRYALQSLTESRLPELTFRDTRFVYCYPFAIPSRISWEKLEAAIARVGKEGRLAGARPNLVEDMDLSDIWNSDIYQGLVLMLPPVNVATTAGLNLRHSVEFRFSKFGNHYIRLEHDGTDLGCHDIYQGLRRVSHVMGVEKVTWLDGAPDRSWKRLHEFAADLLKSLADQVDDATTDDWFADFRNDFNVVLEIRRASIRGEDGREREATGHDVIESAGRLLLNPVTSYATALEEWTRRETPTEFKNLSEDAGYDSDVVARTDNTTLLVLPGSPSWVYLGHEEEAEFVASLRPLLRRWQRELRVRKEKLAGSLRPGELERTKRGQVESERLELAGHVADVRSCLDRLHSNELCRPAVHRRLVDRLYVAAGLDRHEEELEAEIREVEALYTLFAAYLSAAEELKARAEEIATSKYQRSIQVILGVLAALSLVGLFDAINQFSQASAADRVPSPWATAELVFVLLAAAAIALTFWLMGRPRGRHGRGT